MEMLSHSLSKALFHLPTSVCGNIRGTIYVNLLNTL